MEHLLSHAVSEAVVPTAAILVIDDDALALDTVSLVLESRKYKVHRCASARAGLAHLRAGNVPDLILLDLVMPEITGWEFRLEQRRCSAWSRIPVIAMSASAAPQAAAVDADAYLTKPIGNATLIETVERVLDEARKAREDAQRSELERLSALGLVAAGVAHEINNPLAFIMGNLDLAQRHLQELQRELDGVAKARAIAISRLMGHMDHGAKRIRDVVRNVSAFSRPEAEEPVAIDVTDVLESSIQLVGNELRHRARLERRYDAVPRVLGSATKLGQVFLNLLSNAVQAFDEGGSDQHTIRVGVCQGQDGSALMTIADNGPGVPPAHLARIFEPFFSTKTAACGMGLGLAICQRLIADMGGTIHVESEPGKGTSFTITLPGLAADQLDAPPAPQPHAVSRPRRARVLVIDDEPLMCELLKSTLESSYEVEVCTRAPEALTALQRGEGYDAILCDLMMPELSGMDLHAELSRSQPELGARMIFMTGGTFTSRAQQFLERLSAGYLEKPFRVTEAEKLIERCLDEHGFLRDRAREN